MALEFYFSSIYLVLSILGGIITYMLYNVYKEFPIRSFLYYNMIALFVTFFSLTYALNYFYDYKFRYGDEGFYLMDTLLTIFAVIIFLFVVLVIEAATGPSYTVKSIIFTFFIGGTVIGELLENGPLSFFITGSFELIGMFYVFIVVFQYLKGIRKYVINENFYRMTIVAFVLLFIGLIHSSLMGTIDMYVGGILMDILAETWGIEFLIGMLILMYVIYKVPLSTVGVVAEPTALFILTSEGDKLYEYYFKQNLDKLKRKEIAELIRGTYLTTRNLMDKKSKLQLLKTTNFNIIACYEGDIVGLFLVKYDTMVVRDLVDLAVRTFQKDITTYLEKGELEKIDIERLAHFDHMVKFYFPQVAR